MQTHTGPTVFTNFTNFDYLAYHVVHQQAFGQIGISYFDVAYQSLDEILSLEITSLLSSTAFKKYFEHIAAEDKKGTEENKREQFTFAVLILKVSSVVIYSISSNNGRGDY